MYSINPSLPSSFPLPLIFQPPKGTLLFGKKAELILMLPASSLDATLSARLISEVYIDAVNSSLALFALLYHTEDTYLQALYRYHSLA